MIQCTSRSFDSQWYVLQTKARHETVAEHNLNNQGFTTFVPWLRVQRRSHGRWTPVREPLFPGYLFIELDLEEQNTAPIRSTRGVIRLVRLGATLQAFPLSLLEALMHAQEVEGDAIDPARMLESGDEVTLLDGPMAGLNAIFKSRNSQERVVLLLNVLGTETRVSVSLHSIEKAG
ncbi:transcription/translation regulatory transformer protein RfaH [bacterium]|nr:transcription/translation regulatory transformer protein RfaH [bacterium]